MRKVQRFQPSENTRTVVSDEREEEEISEIEAANPNSADPRTRVNHFTECFHALSAAPRSIPGKNDFPLHSRGWKRVPQDPDHLTCCLSSRKESLVGDEEEEEVLTYFVPSTWSLVIPHTQSNPRPHNPGIRIYCILKIKSTFFLQYVLILIICRKFIFFF